MDYDFMKAKMINSIADGFEKIKAYKAEDSVIQLTPEQVQEIKDNGFSIIMVDGKERKVTWDDLMVTKEDAEKMKNETTKRIKEDKNTPKIITPPTKKILHKKSGSR
jgi:vacuolar-type H+-ATPase subunit F/Vma7